MFRATPDATRVPSDHPCISGSAQPARVADTGSGRGPDVASILFQDADGELMIPQHRTARRTRITSISVGVLFLVLANSGCEPLAEGPSGASPNTAQSGDLSACPDLRSGRRDPVNGMNCVRWLQQALQDNGYPNQRLTGIFAELTERNVLDFQRSHNIYPISGIVGPKTRAALLGGGTPPPADQSIPQVTPAGSFSHSYCEDSACHFYLRRATTRRYAERLDAHPALGSVVSGALLQGACRVLKGLNSASVVCGVLAGGVADYVGNQLKKAARQHGCLRLSVRLLPRGTGWRLFEARPDNSWRCSD